MKINNFERAFSRLKEALETPDSNKLKVDACIQRFEFTYETCKKTLAFILKERDIITSNPRETIRVAEQQGLISNLEIWDQMRDDRNDTTHEYDEEKSQEIYEHIPKYAKEFEFVLKQLATSN